MIHFLSDVHLKPKGNSKANDLFREYLSLDPPQALYILGDLFEYWVEHPALDMAAWYDSELQGLRKWSNQGCEIFFLWGNRDFLAAEVFSELSGAKVLGNEILIERQGLSIHLEHGDRYCTGDFSYQCWRKFSRASLSRAFFRVLPGFVARRLLDILRAGSQKEIQRKSSVQMGLDQKAVEGLTPSSADVVICGHVHQEQKFQYRQGALSVYTLPPWEEKGGYLKMKEGKLEMERICRA